MAVHLNCLLLVALLAFCARPPTALASLEGICGHSEPHPQGSCEDSSTAKTQSHDGLALLSSAPSLLQRGGRLTKKSEQQPRSLWPAWGEHVMQEGQHVIQEVNLATLSQLQESIKASALRRFVGVQKTADTPSLLVHRSAHHFFASTTFVDWLIFGLAAFAAILIRRFVLDHYEKLQTGHRWPQQRLHILCLLAWVGLGGIYATGILARFGTAHMKNWIGGYIMELVFSVENIFIFQVIVRAFKLRHSAVAKALDVVVWGQILFEAFFFMGFAAWLRKLRFLPFALGLWLIFLGCSSLLDSRRTASGTGFNFANNNVVQRVLEPLFGKRLLFRQQKDSSELVVLHESRWHLSLAGIAACTLLLADFLLEIDSVLTKIEEMKTPFLAWTSSALATFAIPELFVLSEDLLWSFPLLKYGISLVLCLFGIQMLMAPRLILSPLTTCSIVISVLAGSMLLSALQSCLGKSQPPSEDLSEGSEEENDEREGVEESSKEKADVDWSRGLKECKDKADVDRSPTSIPSGTTDLGY
eukprot:TRINITY_DN10765_c0_g1_i1.p1 TRINITY_DN10765_c0_g1~~TRINITY_DN10765_c0_g1_i1.p1  ORF type:complete len:543 (+),score=72.31 TRINITY_DN10765_c0_g1_i1:44-1630(+)